jgi:DNA sulfur modification protein DndC
MAIAEQRQQLPTSTGGFLKNIGELIGEVQRLYLEDEVPWVVGYSGGKDSTATLQLVWMALADLPSAQRHKPVHVISTDTLVENPVVASWVGSSLEVMARAAEQGGLPLQAHRLTPTVEDSFWVNLIGKGYPAPRPKFRWCTERLKIKPSNAFIRDMVRDHGEAILVLGVRKAESQVRARAMVRAEQGRIRDRLSPNTSLPNSLVYSPIEDWSNDDVWLFLMQTPNPWGYDNKALLTMYQGASPDGECPLVVDSSTPSCGDSRFGCWTCTLVDKDKSMQAMISNDEEKEWMLPLLKLRNALDVDDRHLRDFRRMDGRVQLFHGRPIHGPYKQWARENWLKMLLEAQLTVRELGPAEVEGIELITHEELEEIRRIWVIEKREFEDLLPEIYEGVTGERYEGVDYGSHRPLGRLELDLLRELCGEDELRYQLVRDLLAVEREYRTQAVRSGLYKELTKVVKRHGYDSVEEAEALALTRRDRLDVVQVQSQGDEPLEPQLIADGYVALEAGPVELLEAEARTK